MGKEALGAENELFSRLNADLKRLEHYFMKGEHKGRSLQATEWVDEISIRMVAAKDRDGRTGSIFSLMLIEPCGAT